MLALRGRGVAVIIPRIAARLVGSPRRGVEGTARPTERLILHMNIVFRTEGRGTASLALLLLAFGCLERGAVTIEEPPGTVACRRGPECDAKWQRALEWVRANSRWNVLEATEAVIRTEGPLDTLVPAFTIRRLGRSDQPGSDAIVFEAGCSPERVGVAVDHMPPHGPRWRNVSGAEAKHTECSPPVGELEASFVRFVNAGGAMPTPR